jgi:hypothetical protein
MGEHHEKAERDTTTTRRVENALHRDFCGERREHTEFHPLSLVTVCTSWSWNSGRARSEGYEDENG